MARYRIPALSTQDVQTGLSAAHLELSPRRCAALTGRINVALANYVTMHIADSGRPTQTSLRQRLTQIHRTAGHRDGAGVQCLFNDPRYEAARRELRAIAIVSGEPADDLGRNLPQLQDIAKRALRLVNGRIQLARMRAEKGKQREARHTGDRPRLMLLGTLNTLWATYFRKVPGMTLGGQGPYARFLRVILKAFTDKLDADIQHEFPAIRRKLQLTPQALHGLFRRTHVSKILAVAKRLAEKN